MRYLKNKNLNKIANKNHQAPKWRNRKELRTSTGGPFPTTFNYYSIFNHRKSKANLAFKNGGGGGGENHLSYKDKNYSGLFRNHVVRKCGLKY